jgi:hypothetical protein
MYMSYLGAFSFFLPFFQFCHNKKEFKNFIGGVYGVSFLSIPCISKISLFIQFKYSA